MEELQEKSLHRETAAVEIVQKKLPFAELDSEVQLAVRCADDKKASRITILDLRPEKIDDAADYSGDDGPASRHRLYERKRRTFVQ